MAGSAMTFTRKDTGRSKKITVAWTSDGATGSVSGTTTWLVDGKLLGVGFVPGTAGDAPDDNYDVTVSDDDGLDILFGQGLNRDTANKEYLDSSVVGYAPLSLLTVAVTNAGNSNKGTIVLYVSDKV